MGSQIQTQWRRRCHPEILDFELGAMTGRGIELFLSAEKEVCMLCLAKGVEWIFDDKKSGLWQKPNPCSLLPGHITRLHFLASPAV